MKEYFEIRLLPDLDFSRSILMNVLYNKLHRAFAELQCMGVGVSFPEYNNGDDKVNKIGLGTVMRIHGSQLQLQALLNTDWLRGLHDHIIKGNISPVPNNVQNAVFRRVQVKSNVERLRRRQMRRNGFSYEEVLKKIPDSVVEKTSSLPFVTIKSQSTGQIFKLFIEQKKQPAAMQGDFNTYGLSKDATVPLF